MFAVLGPSVALPHLFESNVRTMKDILFVSLLLTMVSSGLAATSSDDMDKGFFERKLATRQQNEALRIAAYKGQLELVKHALEGNHLHFDTRHGNVHGPRAPVANHNNIHYDRNYKDPFTTQYTALHAAGVSGNFDIVDVLLEHGWSPDTRNREGAKPSEIARRSGNTDLFEYLKSKETPEPTRQDEL